LKTLYQLQKIGYFRILAFELKLDISGTLKYKFVLMLFNEKESKAGIKSKA
jgi:hypothetical protein